jgi:hypothetical protein
MLSDVVSQIDSTYDNTVDNHILVLWGAINDLYPSGAVLSTIQNNYTTYVQGRVAKGFKVIVCTCTSARGASYASRHPEVDSIRQQFNTWLRSNWQTIGASCLVDLSSDYRLGEYDSGLNTTYFNDGIHMTLSGKTIVADMVERGIISVATDLVSVIPGAENTDTTEEPGGTIVYTEDAPDTGYLAVENDDTNWVDATPWTVSSSVLTQYYLGDGRGSTTGIFNNTRKVVVRARYIDLFTPWISGAGTLEFKVTRVSDGVVMNTKTWNHNQNTATGSPGTQRAGYPDGNTPQLTIDTAALDIYEVQLRCLGGGSGAVAMDSIRIRKV